MLDRTRLAHARASAVASSAPSLGRAPACSAAALVVAAAAAAQAPPESDPTQYAGDGFVADVGLVAAGAAASLLDVDGDGELDLVALGADGALAVARDVAEYDEVATIAGGVLAVAATRTGGADRLWAATASGVHPVTWDDLVAGVLPAALSFDVSSPERLRSQLRGATSKVTLLDSAGQRVRVFAVDAAGAWTLVSEHVPAPGDGRFHDALVVDWAQAGDGVALVTDRGLDVLDANGGLLQHVPGLPEDPFLEVLEGARTPAGKDLLFWQTRFDPTWPLTILIANDDQSDLLYTEGVGLRSLAFASFLGEPYPQLVLPRGDVRQGTLSKQTGSQQAPLFWLDMQDVATIDLAPAVDSPTPPAAPPAVAVADLDEDGDEDAVFVDDSGQVFVVLAATFDADESRVLTGAGSGDPRLLDEGPPTFTQTIELVAPPGVTQVEWEVWYLPEGAAYVDPEPLETGTAPTGVPLELSVELPSASPFATIEILLRPVAADDPVAVYWWIPDPDDYEELVEETGSVYPWTTSSSAVLDPGGGTTRRPQIGPINSQSP